MMIILDSTSESLEILLGAAITTTQLPFTASYADHNATAPSFTPGSSDGQTNNTTAVTLVGNPGAGVQRQVKRLGVFNTDTAPATVTIRLNNGGTLRTLLVVSLLPNDRIEYEDGNGFQIFNSGGEVRSQGVSPSPTAGLKNYLINGAYQINQINFAGGALAAGVYGYDMWKAGAGGCNITANLTTGVVTHTSGPIVQIMESPRLAGEVVTVSVEDLNGGNLSVNVDGQLGTIVAGAGRKGATVTVPIGSTGNVTLTLTGTGVTYRNVQIERGPIATAFGYVPIGVTLSMAQRYLTKLQASSAFAIFAIGAVANNIQANFIVPTPTTMRATPAVITSGNIATLVAGVSTAITALTAASVAAGGVQLQSTVSGTSWANTSTAVLHANSDITASITLDARL